MDSCGGPGTQTSVPRNKNQRRPSRRDSFYRQGLPRDPHGATALGGDRARAIVRVASQRGASGDETSVKRTTSRAFGSRSLPEVLRDTNYSESERQKYFELFVFLY